MINENYNINSNTQTVQFQEKVHRNNVKISFKSKITKKKKVILSKRSIILNK